MSVVWNNNPINTLRLKKKERTNSKITSRFTGSTTSTLKVSLRTLAPNGPLPTVDVGGLGIPGFSLPQRSPLYKDIDNILGPRLLM